MAVGVMYAGDFLLKMHRLQQQVHLLYHLELLSRIFRKERLYPCRLGQRVKVKRKAFLGGVLSGVVEPIGAVMTILAAQLVIPALPYLLSFAAGAMLYVVVEELIQEMSQDSTRILVRFFFALGFSLMMILDVALG